MEFPKGLQSESFFSQEFFASLAGWNSMEAFNLYTAIDIETWLFKQLLLFAGFQSDSILYKCSGEQLITGRPDQHEFKRLMKVKKKSTSRVEGTKWN